MDERGFTLVETMIALLIGTIGLISLGSFTIASTKESQVGRERITASFIAEQVMEVWQFSNVDKFPDIDGACDPTPSTIIKSMPYSVVCNPTFGESSKYTVTGSESIAGGPNKFGTGAFVGFSQGTYANAPWVKLVSVIWWRDGRAHSVFLSHLTAVK